MSTIITVNVSEQLRHIVRVSHVQQPMSVYLRRCIVKRERPKRVVLVPGTIHAEYKSGTLLDAAEYATACRMADTINNAAIPFPMPVAVSIQPYSDKPDRTLIEVIDALRKENTPDTHSQVSMYCGVLARITYAYDGMASFKKSHFHLSAAAH